MSDKNGIGLVTPWYETGYGNALRSFALSSFLRSEDYEPLFYDKPLDLWSGRESRLIDSAAVRFFQDHCEVLPALETVERYQEADARCAAFVVGAGDVWNYEHIGESGHFFFLDFALSSKPKIAFAIDCRRGGSRPYEYGETAKQHLKGFAAASAVGRKSQWILKEDYNLTTTTVADPLFLLEREDYERLAVETERSQGSFVYARIDSYDEHAASLCSEVAQYAGLDLVTDVGDSVEDWICLVKNSALVITDSYDTLLLALIFNKPFAAIASQGNRAQSALAELLESWGLATRLYDSGSLPVGYEQAFLKPPKYNFINAAIKDAGKRSAKWLLGALQEAIVSDGVESANEDPALKHGVEHFVGRTLYTPVDYKIQNLVFPSYTWQQQHFWLFNRGDQMAYASSPFAVEAWMLKAGSSIECSTYFNALSVQKWLRYASVSRFNLHLQIKGKFKIRVLGLWLEPGITANTGGRASLAMELQTIRSLEVDYAVKQELVKTVIDRGEVLAETLGEHSFDYSYLAPEDDPAEVVVPIHYDHATLVAFELIADTSCMVFGGYYSALGFEELLNPVDISVCMTTFNKEEFATSNMELLKNELLLSQDRQGMEELAEHLYVHLIDNGRTLDPELYEISRLRVHPNLNTGGAGGFTRGMLETIYAQERGEFDATHILLMDDDIRFLPESLKRTYGLLRFLKEEHKSRFISGAMFFLEEMNRFHEDVGILRRHKCEYGSQKPTYYMHTQEAILKCEEYDPDDFDESCSYAGWWYCAIPMSAITRDNLPLPLFFRGDDVEFSLRNKARFITMNGICVWHLGFVNKFSAALEYYLVHRNSLFISAASNFFEGYDFIKRIDHLFRKEIYRLHYAAAEQLLDAVEDFLVGPEFFATSDSEQIMKEHIAKNEKMMPFSAFDYTIDLDAIYRWNGLNESDKRFYKGTDNGHLLPDGYLVDRDQIPVISYDWFESPGTQFLQKKLIVANKYAETAALRVMDRERYAQLMERHAILMKRFETEHETVVARYRDYAEVFHSEEFWRGYLGLDES
jgi:GT2 family glycosyltransferase